MFTLRRSSAVPQAAFVVVLLLAILSSAWGAPPNTGMQGRTWVLKAHGSDFRPAKGEVTLRLQDGKIGGSGGINTYGGEYTIEDGKLAVGELISTKMAGDAALMAQEQAFFEALGQAVIFRAEAYRLMLFDAQGRLLLLFEPEGAPEEYRPIIHAPTSGERIGMNVTIAGRTGTAKLGLVSVTTEVYVNGSHYATVPGHRSETTPEGKFWLRVATPRPNFAEDGQGVSYLIRVQQLDRQNQPRGPEAFVLLYPDRAG